jgi:hypothetical protein
MNDGQALDHYPVSEVRMVMMRGEENLTQTKFKLTLIMGVFGKKTSQKRLNFLSHGMLIIKNGL